MNKLFDGNFDDVLEDLHNVYYSHKPKKGDSWKKCEIEWLHTKLVEELDEFDISNWDYKELYDAILCSLMLAKRLRDDEDED